ncbi:hypothetical protein [Blastococcus sp. TF02A-30]|uniref:hypothetical protein n=1 Tax=Blastococcus sp. TF02A-30 TaxID=2250580 RepID=UPI000DE8874F|nr:hypothetical protein [Blastococcus sp. TF02A-30]RBY89599.1 hypothetical protein DQ241_09185 [Blastococcus sp. TF02A-30]
MADHSGASGSEKLLYGALLLLAVVGIASPGRFSSVPAGSLLELTFLGTAGLLVLRSPRVRPAGWALLLVGGFYVFLKTLLWAVYSDAALPDFLQAYKAFFYLVALGFLVGKQVFDGPRLAQFSTLLIGAFLVKYGYSVALGLADRPGIYIENNFELIMLMGLFYLSWPWLGARRNLVFLALAFIVLISGSRSAALGLICIYLPLFVRTSNRTWPLHVAGAGAVGYAVFWLFSSRAQQDAGARLDRLVFMDTFRYEVRDWPIWEFLTGSFPLTPLSPGSCGSLRFYEALFSSSDPGVCYSVILHSYFLRAFFDHGVLGLALLYVLVWIGLRRSGVPLRDTLALLALISVSGLSVSAFNNVFVAITLGVAMALDRSAAPVEPATDPPVGGRPFPRSAVRAR